MQSTNNIYLILEPITYLPLGYKEYEHLLPYIIRLYHGLGEFKIEPFEIFMNMNQELLFLPFYKNLCTSSKIYAQFHNKAVLGQVFAGCTSINQNIAL